jgi:DNA-directed RNA polymerase subunit H (RpoH/RPB5)
MLAALDYLVEKGEIVRVTRDGETMGRYQIFRAPLR